MGLTPGGWIVNDVVTPKFSEFIADRTKDFNGREWVFREYDFVELIAARGPQRRRTQWPPTFLHV